MINQNFENITQSGTSQTITAEAGGLVVTEIQGYCIIFGTIIILLTLIISITKLIQSVIFRCNYISPRLKQEIIRELKEEK